MKQELFLSVHKPQAKFTWSPRKSVHPGLLFKSRDPFPEQLISAMLPICQVSKDRANMGRRCLRSKHNERFVKPFLREVFEPGPRSALASLARSVFGGDRPASLELNSPVFVVSYE